MYILVWRNTQNWVARKRCGDGATLGACKWSFIFKTPVRKGVEQKENCVSRLLLFSELEQFGQEAWKVSCETTSLGSSMPQKNPYFFLCKLPCWRIFFIAWECAGTLHYRQLFPEAWCLLLVGRIHLALYERSWGVFNHNPLISSISQSSGFLWTVCWMWVLWSKCMCVPDRLRGEDLHLNLLPCELGNRVGKHTCWKVLLMCFLVI